MNGATFGPPQGVTATSIDPASFPLLAPDGSAAAPSYSFSSFPTTGLLGYNFSTGYLGLVTGGTGRVLFTDSFFAMRSDYGMAWTSGNYDGAGDVYLYRDAAAVLALKNGTTAQTLRVYGTTTGPKYASVYHDGTDSYFISGASSGRSFFGNGAAHWGIDTNARFTALSNLGFSHGTSALATTATEGFFHLQTCAGAPTGVPASIPTGQAPFVLDTSNDRLYFYYDDGGGAGWHYIARTA